MKLTSYFLITPRAELIDRLRNSGSAALADLSTPVMWSGDEYDKGALQQSDMELLVKILFLDVLRREHGTDEGFDAVFKGLETSGAYFDSLWSFSRVPLDMSVEDAIQFAIEMGSIGSLAKAGNDRVNQVLTIYQTRGTARIG